MPLGVSLRLRLGAYRISRAALPGHKEQFGLTHPPVRVHPYLWPGLFLRGQTPEVRMDSSHRRNSSGSLAMLAASTEVGLVSERMRRPVKQFKLGRQRRDAQVRLGACEIRLERLQLVGSFR